MPAHTQSLVSNNFGLPSLGLQEDPNSFFGGGTFNSTYTTQDPYILALNQAAGTGQQTTGFDPKGVLGNIFGTLGSEKFQSGLGAFGNLAQIYLGFKSLGLAEDTLDFNKASFNKNFAAAAKDYNNQLRHKWEATRNAHATRGRDYTPMAEWLSSRQIAA